MKRLLISMVLAGVGTALIGFLVEQPGRHWFDVILWPALVLATWVSGNAHQPNEIAFWLLVFTLLVIIVHAINRLVSLFYKRGAHTSL